MLVTAIHIILTYRCNLECDHCFVYSSPRAKGTFTLSQIQNTLAEAVKINTIKRIYFEGGEPFLYYPLLLESVKIAREMGFEVGIVTNAYFASTIEAAEIWLRPLSKLKISDLSISDDLFHYQDERDNPAKHALVAAKRLDIPTNTIIIEKPKIEEKVDGKTQTKGKPVIGGSTIFRGRAVENINEDFPRRPWERLNECPYENLKEPERVHVDPFGNIHLCQGLIMDNMDDASLSMIINNYNSNLHPICKHLIKGVQLN